MPIPVGLPSLAMMLFNRVIRGLFPKMNRDLINVNNDDLPHEALEAHQGKYYKGKDTQKDSPNFISVATVAVWQEDRGPQTHDVIDKPNKDDQRECFSTI